MHRKLEKVYYEIRAPRLRWEQIGGLEEAKAALRPSLRGVLFTLKLNDTTSVSVVYGETVNSVEVDTLNEFAADQRKPAATLPSYTIDPFSAGPFIYRRTDDGFTLYSVAIDRDDDGGRLGDGLERHVRRIHHRRDPAGTRPFTWNRHVLWRDPAG